MLKLVLIPALGCDEELYRPVAPALSTLVDARVLIVAEPTLDLAAARVLSRVEGDFAVAGTSFGGNVALEVALAAPDRVRALWIMGSNAGPPRDPGAGIERGRQLRAGGFDSVVGALAERVTHRPGHLGEAAREAFIRMCGRIGRERMALQNDALLARKDRWPELGGIACPTLLLWGRDDRFTPAADGLRMAGLIAESRFAEIPECGHLPTLEAPDEVSDIAGHWLRDRVL